MIYRFTTFKLFIAIAKIFLLSFHRTNPNCYLVAKRKIVSNQKKFREIRHLSAMQFNPNLFFYSLSLLSSCSRGWIDDSLLRSHLKSRRFVMSEGTRRAVKFIDESNQMGAI